MMAMYKLCRCGKRIEYYSKACDECSKEIAIDKKAKAQRYDRDVRRSKDNKKYDIFYHSKDWVVLSEVVKGNYYGMCAVCAVEAIGSSGIAGSSMTGSIESDSIVESDVTHHINELKECWEERLLEDNLIALCHSCHEKFHVDYDDDVKEYMREIQAKFVKMFK